MANPKSQAIDAAVCTVTECIHMQISQAAGVLGVTPHAVESALWDALIATRPRPDTAAVDKRVVSWAVRIQVFNPGGELEADSDDGAPMDQAGATQIMGLPAVSDWLRQTVHMFHFERGDRVQELDTPTLNRRLKSLRPTLSRNGGQAAWRVPYQVNGTRWLAIVQVQRTEEESADESE